MEELMFPYGGWYSYLGYAVNCLFTLHMYVSIIKLYMYNVKCIDFITLSHTHTLSVIMRI